MDLWNAYFIHNNQTEEDQSLLIFFSHKFDPFLRKTEHEDSISKWCTKKQINRDFVYSRMEIFLLCAESGHKNCICRLGFKDKWIKNIDFWYIFENISKKVRFFFSIFVNFWIWYYFSPVKSNLIYQYRFFYFGNFEVFFIFNE